MAVVGRLALLLFGLGLLVPEVWIGTATGLLAEREQTALRAEIVRGPERSLVKVHSAAATDAPAPVEFLRPPAVAPGSPVGLLEIPALSLSTVFVEGTEFGHLSKAPGHLEGSPLPGAGGNTVLVGHRSLFGGPFRDLVGLERGDEMRLLTSWGDFTYEAVGRYWFAPDDPAPAAPTEASNLTLITWDAPWGGAPRLVVRARLIGGTAEVPIVEAPAPDPLAEAALPEQDPLLTALPRLRAISLSPRAGAAPASAPEPPAEEPPAPASEPGAEATLPAAAPDPAPVGPQSGGGGFLPGGGLGPIGPDELPETPESPPPAPPPTPAPSARGTQASPEPSPSALHRPVDRSQPACRDGLDNDGDGLIDYRALDGSRQDRECNGPDDDDE